MAKMYLTSVRGREKRWCLQFAGTPEQLRDMREDGVEVDEIENTIPESLPRFIPVRWWCFVQDCLGFRNPFRGRL